MRGGLLVVTKGKVCSRFHYRINDSIFFEGGTASVYLDKLGALLFQVFWVPGTAGHGRDGILLLFLCCLLRDGLGRLSGDKGGAVRAGALLLGGGVEHWGREGIGLGLMLDLCLLALVVDLLGSRLLRDDCGGGGLGDGDGFLSCFLLSDLG